MEQTDKPKSAVAWSGASQMERPVLSLDREDIGDLDAVLRTYYLSQIKGLEKRKDRKLARRLLEDHLVLPKSRQRTSKDAAYIKEILGIEYGLLQKLEESRLIRRIHKTGNNPIYEVSHDTLVEPILAEKRDRDAITRFLKKSWKYLLLLLLLWFLLGMFFESAFEVVPPIAQDPKRIDIMMEEQALGIGEDEASILLPLSPIVLDQKLIPQDSIYIQLPIDPIRLASIPLDTPADSLSDNKLRTTRDTLNIRFGKPIEVPAGPKGEKAVYRPFRNVVVPLAYTSGQPEAERVYARLSGTLKMLPEVSDYEFTPRRGTELVPLDLSLGDTLLKAGKTAQSVPVSFTLQLSDLLEDETDKNTLRDLVGDRRVNLRYVVKVSPSPVKAPPPKVVVPSVQGIELQYSDGTSKFISGDQGGEETQTVHTVAEGESLFSIARDYKLMDDTGKISVTELKRINGLENNIVTVGQQLIIPRK